MTSYSKTAALNLEKNVTKFRGEMHYSPFAYLFVELVKYSMSNAQNMDVVQRRLADFGKHVSERMVDLVYMREKPQKRDTRLYTALMFLKTTFWKSLFGKEADELEQDNVDENTYYLIEREPLVNRFTRFSYEKNDKKPNDVVPLNTAVFNGGVVETFLTNTGFPCTVTVIWYKGTAYAIKFDESVAHRERQLGGK